jgi:hypothetical protein
MHARPALAGLLLVAAVCSTRADPAVAQFAGAQLDMAQAQLDQARAALRTHDYATARRLAALAGLDARLAWGMTESDALRRLAIEVGREAERLRSRSLLSAGTGP